MSAPHLTERQYVAPSATSLTVVPPGSAYGSSPWVVVEDLTDTDWILTGIVASPAADYAGGGDIGAEFEVAVGLAAELPICTYRLIPGYQSTGGQFGGKLFTYVLNPGIDMIPLGARVNIRMRIGSISTVPWRVAITYFKKPFLAGSTYLSTTTLAGCLPSAADGAIMSTPVTAWASSPWMALRGATGPAMLVSSLFGRCGAGGSQYEVDLGKGSAGAEVVKATGRWMNDSGFSFGEVMRFPNPLQLAAAGERVAVRARCHFGGPQTVSAGVNYS